MNFSSPQLVTDTLRAGDEVERIRSANRTLVNNGFNGMPFLDDATAKKWHLECNFNVGEMPVLAAHARRQYNNAVLGSLNYFKASLPMAPEEKKSGWGTWITNFINRVMKKSEDYSSLKEFQISSVVAHGIGPQMWRDAENWLPDYVAVEDFRVATDTKTSFKELSWMAERHLYTPGELCQKVFGNNADPRWDKKAISKILDSYKDINYTQSGSYSWITNPEKIAELWKQNLGYWCSDAVPSISLWHFLYYDDTDPKDCYWKLCVVPDWSDGAPRGCSEPVFLFNSGKKPFARKTEHIVSVQYGDLNNKAPFMFHSVRSLGFLLMEPCFWSNLSICRELQYLMESFNPWFRVEDPADRARVQKIDLAGQSILEKGVSIVPNTERHQVNPQTIASVKAQMKQLQSECSQTYTQSTDTGTAREQTAFETKVKLSAVNAMMTGLLGRFFRKETHAYREICRRFCLRKTSNPDAKAFQEAAKREGIPAMWLNVEHWEIEAEMPMGSGNPTMAMASVQDLMSVYSYLSPTAQNEVVHEFVEVATNDPRKAERLVPIGKDAVLSQGKELASALFGSLMTGVPVPIRDSVPPADLIETWLGMSAGVISDIEQRDNMGSPQELNGLQNVFEQIGMQIQRLAQIQSEKAKVKQYGDALGQLQNIWKGFAQRLAEKNEAMNMDQEQMAKIKALEMTTQAKIQSKQLTDAQKLSQKQQSHEQKISQKEQSFESEQQRKDLQVAADLEREGVTTAAEQHRETFKTATQIGNESAKTSAQIANEKQKAKAAASSEKKAAAN